MPAFLFFSLSSYIQLYLEKTCLCKLRAILQSNDIVLSDSIRIDMELSASELLNTQI